MEKYIIVTSKAFEKTEKFQARINDLARKGYRVVNMTHTGGSLCVLFEKLKLACG